MQDAVRNAFAAVARNLEMYSEKMLKFRNREVLKMQFANFIRTWWRIC